MFVNSSYVFTTNRVWKDFIQDENIDDLLKILIIGTDIKWTDDI